MALGVLFGAQASWLPCQLLLPPALDAVLTVAVKVHEADELSSECALGVRALGRPFHHDAPDPQGRNLVGDGLVDACPPVEPHV